MPFTIKKINSKYRLYNTDKKKLTKKTFNTRKAAMNTRRVYMNYDKIRR